MLPFWNWLGKNHDTLGVVIGLIGVPVLIFQITQASRQERSRLRRRHIAARAALPLTLSGICKYAERSAQAFLAVHRAIKNREDPDFSNFDPPSAPASLVSSLEQMIEASSHDALIIRLSEIIAKIQVVDSWLADTRRDHRMMSGVIDGCLADAALIDALASSLFSYARRDVPAPPSAFISTEEAEASLHRLRVWDMSYPDVYERIKSRCEEMNRLVRA